MNLKYKGVNIWGRVEWVELDLASSFHPEGIVMEEWQVQQYKPFVEEIQTTLGRELTKKELHTIQWLSGFEQSSVNNILGIINAAHDHGYRKSKQMKGGINNVCT